MYVGVEAPWYPHERSFTWFRYPGVIYPAFVTDGGDERGQEYRSRRDHAILPASALFCLGSQFCPAFA
jgi:hypothetical protein